MRIFRNVSAFLVSLSVAILCCYCAPGPLKRQLSDIESFIDSRPDSALAAIRQIDVAALRGGATKAKYALLHAAALDKNYIDTADTRIVQPAVDWYDRHGSPEEKLKANMYLGVEQYNAGQFNQAIVSFSKAAKFAESVEDQNLLGILYSRMADTFTRTREHSQASRYINESLKCFRKSGRVDQENKERLREASNLAQLRKWNEADSSFRKIINDPTIDTKLLSNAKLDYSMFLMTSPFADDEKSFCLISDVIHDGGLFRSQYEQCAYAYLLNKFGHFDSADAIWSKIDSSENDRSKYYYNYWKYREAANNGDHKKAFLYLSSAMESHESFIIEAYSKSAALSENDFLQALNAKQEIRLKYNRAAVAVSVLLCFCLVMMLYILYLYHQRYKLNKEEDEVRFNMAIESLKDTILEKDNRIKEISKVNQLKNHRNRNIFVFLSDLYEKVYIKTGDDSDFENKLQEALKAYIGNLRADPSARKTFQEMVDRKMGGLLKKFKRDFPDLSENEYDMASYYFAGFDNTTVSIIMGDKSTDYIRLLKYRLRQKIKATNVKDAASYLDLL